MTPTSPKKSMTTRLTNSLHPAFKVGAAAPARRCHTRAQIEADDAAEAAKAAEAKAAEQAKIQKVANLEDKITEENSVDVTPHPQCPLPQRQADLRHCETYIEAPSSGDEGMEVDDNHTSDVDFAQPTEGGGDTDIKEVSGPTKKVKVAKLGMHDAVDMACKASEGMKGGEGGSKQSNGGRCHTSENGHAMHDGNDKLNVSNKVPTEMFIPFLLSLSCFL